MTRALAAILCLVLPIASARAQVGYDPARSPYRDVDYRQEFTAFAGWLFVRHDPAGVVPRSAPIEGIHYEWRAGGPAFLTGEVARASSNRSVIDPTRPLATRLVGERMDPLYAADVGLALALSGAKSYHHLVPLVKGGIGLVSDFRSKPDTGGFTFGTRFALTWGAAVRWVPGGSWELRGDLTNRLYTVGYPPSYYTQPTGGGAPVLSSDIARSRWTNNPALTLGIAYLFSR